jgi:hypothetical protein
MILQVLRHKFSKLTRLPISPHCLVVTGFIKEKGNLDYASRPTVLETVVLLIKLISLLLKSVFKKVQIREGHDPPHPKV